MRYLGKVYNSIKDKDLHHLKTFFEREAIVRSVKHLFNEQLRETNDSYVSKVLAHLFNMLLAPFSMIDKMNEGAIVYPVT